MGLFDKKYCDICGEKIGLLGNRKLEDGNCCKDCASKLSYWMTDRRSSTVEEIKQHLAYREANWDRVAAMKPTRTFGNGTKIYLDEEKGQFFVARYSNWQGENPDVLDLSQVTACRTSVEEHKTELYDKDANGKRIRFDPPRYEVEYEFTVEIDVDSPWFNEISFELTKTRPDSQYTDAYRDYERQAEEIRRALDPEARRKAELEDKLKQALDQGLAAVVNAAKNAAASKKWFCPKCGTENEGNFCTACGTKKPQPPVRCTRCGWQTEADSKPRFCPQCGTPFEA